MSKTVIGIDISKAKFDAAVLLPNDKVKTKKFDNKIKGFEDFVLWLKKIDSVGKFHICMEATGNYGENLAIYLYDAGHVVSVVNPAQIKAFGQSRLIRTKNDRTDAVLIAHFCCAIQPRAWEPDPSHVRELQCLVRRLEALQSMHQQEINRSYVATESIKNSIEAICTKLMEEIKGIKDRIKVHILENPDLARKKGLLETIPGVGEATIMQVLAFMNNVEDFKSAKQYSAFVGLNPKQRQSGSSVHGRSRISKTGSSSLRKVFYLPAVSAKRFNPIIRAFCERLIKAGKPVMVVIGAAMRKLLHLIYGVLKTGRPFDITLIGKAGN